jgi:hypothetical protein
MDIPADVLVKAIDALPDHPSNDEIAAVFAAYDRLTAWLSEAVDGVDCVADGAVTVAQWLRTLPGARIATRRRWCGEPIACAPVRSWRRPGPLAIWPRRRSMPSWPT